MIGAIATWFLELGDGRIIEVEPSFCLLVVAVCRVVTKIEGAKVIDHAVQVVYVALDVVVGILLIQILIHIQAGEREVDVVLVFLAIFEALEREDQDVR